MADELRTDARAEPSAGLPRGPAVVSLFTGAGGLDLGLERAGFRTVSAVDLDADCVATLRANQEQRLPLPRAGGTHLDGTALVHGDVSRLHARELTPATGSLPAGLGPACPPSGRADGQTLTPRPLTPFGAPAGWRPTLLAGGPPCQPFSSAGAQRGIMDPRGSLFVEFVRLADELRPDLVLFENVRGLATARGRGGAPGEVLGQVRAMFEEVGYSTRFALLNSADYGAAQRRVRLFMLGARRGAAPAFPLPTHHRQGGLGLLPWRSLGDLLATMPQPPAETEVSRPSPALAELLAPVPDGKGLRSPGRAEPTRPGGHWGYKQGTFVADLGLPARTVTAATTQDWVRLPGQGLRRLTLRECAALQGFPPGWVFEGARASRWRQVGNAVPAHFGEVLGAALAAHAAAMPRAGGPAASAALPPAVEAAIAYTARDDARNGHVRPRSPRYAALPA